MEISQWLFVEGTRKRLPSGSIMTVENRNTNQNKPTVCFSCECERAGGCLSLITRRCEGRNVELMRIKEGGKGGGMPGQQLRGQRSILNNVVLM